MITARELLMLSVYRSLSTNLCMNRVCECNCKSVECKSNYGCGCLSQHDDRLELSKRDLLAD